MLAGLGAFGGTKILVDPGMVDWKEDWSKVRSPGRARRRMRKGHKQNIPELYALGLDDYI